jgi:hypothetical protein
MKRNFSFILYCLFIAGVIFYADREVLPDLLLSGVPHYDWLGHIGLYGLFFCLLDTVLGQRQVKVFSLEAPHAFLFTTVILTGEEFSQLFIASRIFSFVDLFYGNPRCYPLRAFEEKKGGEKMFSFPVGTGKNKA